ncbi:MAG: SPASM domain-containing protein [Clostridiales bacterium]|nr:SPASM domain-containing protein [Clostridiales bacterium]
MNFTLHLTADCDLACRYCYEKHGPERMDEAAALAACDLLFSFGHKTNGFSLFGGEPLLCRKVIEKTLRYAAEKNWEIGGKLAYRMTTNGVLLDEDFLDFADEHNIMIALSHDGPLQDEQRVFKNGAGTSEALEPKIDMLLSHQPEAVVMATFLPKNAGRVAETVEWLYNRGFSRINTCIDYRPEADWNDENMAELDRQYALLEELCEKHFDSPRPLRYLNFESKIASYLNGRPCIECRLGVKQPSIAPDGKIYPCNQFLNDPRYLMGDVWSGIDAAAQRRIFFEAQKPEASCEGCAIEQRCRHHCACLNFSMTGDMHKVPPVQCAHERSLIRHADGLAKRLYESGSPRFMRVYGNNG